MEPKTIKIALWHVIVLISALLMWGGAAQVHFSSVTGVSVQIPSFGAFLMLTSMLGIGFILFRQMAWLWVLTVSAIVGGLFILQFGPSWLNLTGAGIFLAFCYEASNRTGREVDERLKINISAFLWRGLLPIVLGLFVLVSFAAYQSPLADQIKESGRLPSQTTVFFGDLINKAIVNKVGPADAASRQEEVSQIVNQTYADVNNFLKPYFRYAPPILAFALFLILWGLSWPVSAIAVLVGMIWFWILKKVGVVKIGERDIKAETLIV
ncbi:MAG TPA: hypothetical protein VG941_02315 [Candidatus Paceibacterota bacterium]|nr:hypothetical protein [Candidatus Paceibacterota bacterium]